jgi:chromosome segregation ATPase
VPVDDLTWLEQLFAGTTLAALIAAVWGPVRDWRSGALRRGRAEADAAEDAVPMTGAERDLALVRAASEHLAAQLAAAELRVETRDRQLAQADAEITALRAARRADAEAMDELERRLDLCEGTMATLRDELDQARATIAALRGARRPGDGTAGT